MSLESVPVRAFRGSEFVEARIEYAACHESGEVRAHGPWGVVRAVRWDVFESFREIRRKLEPLGWFLAVNGARYDVYCMGATRNMSNGTAVHEIPRTNETPDMRALYIFDPAEPALVSTVEKQESTGRKYFNL
ncbi:hypothetical protein LX15_004070 [Streptoalloteichus tenebrarius]|uniref:Uncharacterized protein n=1 Tax=Streptoalloteichus tenebrarius (strain ATCC 17920 / DSM 40477 / JCM 4838 / CBS 697.72 / NBRC 16177 / NCIMB 11028 / NRRL B-12390 / A12253. 1 / ISP 5477) TaxID=1933 RepID=A0ABT1HXW9_STRSD|nr:hypothetical protein [Streptoalloteichus tenebrarius]MCP2260356.1 hypothetical protein [Streptoalloteichus tenebrarius]